MKNTLAIAAIMTAEIAYNFWHYLWKGFYYQALAVHFVLIYYLAYQLAEEGFVKKCMYIGVLLSLMNLTDEVFFIPTRFEPLEYVFTVLVFIWVFWIKE